jgi:hypothetical protein
MYPAVPRAVGAAAITVGKIVETGAAVAHDPEWQNWYHGAVSDITDSRKRKLQKAASEIIEIDQTEAARLDELWNSARGALAP